MDVWRVETGAFDLLLTDMVMPGGTSGAELATSLLSLKRDLAVIVSSGYNPDTLEPGTPSDPGIVHLSKPFELGQLGEAIRKELDRKGHHPEASSSSVDPS